jgi:hypothetical protein
VAEPSSGASGNEGFPRGLDSPHHDETNPNFLLGASGASGTVGPHSFAPIRRFFNRGRCRACYWPESEHPREGWSTARPLGEKCAPMVVERLCPAGGGWCECDTLGICEVKETAPS